MVEMLAITTENGKLAVVAPYKPGFVSRAKTLGGKWDGIRKAWVFDANDTDLVKRALRAHYGEDGSPVDRVTVIVDVSDYDNDDEVDILGRILCSRPGRDDCVRLGEGVLLESGGFPGSGGSMKYPKLGKNTAKLRVKGVPRPVAEKAIADGYGVTIVTPAAIDREALEAEAKQIRSRLAEIESLLGVAA
jgi:hypothetical protein